MKLMNGVTVAAAIVGLLLLQGCGSLVKKPTAEATAVKDGRQVKIEMRFDASDMIDRISEAGCDISKVHTEASKRKDEITIDCRVPEGENTATKTIVVTP